MVKMTENKIRWTKKIDDTTFKKLFTFLLTLALLLAFILSVHLLLGVPFSSNKLLIGSVLPFLFINLLTNVKRIHTKLIVLSVSIVIMGIFFHAVLNWALAPSLYAGAIILILSVLLYMTFVS